MISKKTEIYLKELKRKNLRHWHLFLISVRDKRYVKEPQRKIYGYWNLF